MKVTWRPQALRQLEDIHAYIAQDNPRAAATMATRIKATAARLGTRPYLGHKTDREGVRVRKVVRSPYLIFYTIRAERDEVWIIRIRHERQRPL